VHRTTTKNIKKTLLSRITPVLASLHLLPVRHQIIYKVSSITYKARSAKSPPYHQSILQDYISGRAVRSASRNLICERPTKTAKGARAFGVVAFKVWHDLPDSIRSSDSISSFKNNLKTYLFNQAFTS